MKCKITWILTDGRIVFKDIEIDEFDDINHEAYMGAPCDLDCIKKIIVNVIDERK